MAVDLPYLPTYKNVGELFTRIASAKIPDAFTQPFLYNTIGLKSPGDRPLITLLKKLGFLEQSGKPTASYSLLKNKNEAGKAIAQGIKHAYAPLFESNEEAYKIEGEALKGLVAQIAGTDEAQTKSIAYTFSALVKLGNFGVLNVTEKPNKDDSDERSDKFDKDEQLPFKKINGQFHFNIQVHLPSNGSEETYLNIFNALRKAF